MRSASGKLMMPKGGKIYRAVCELQAGVSGDRRPPKGVSGRVELIQVEGVGWTTITYDVRGLKPGSHGFHINELADFSDSSLAGAGPIYNPFGKAHGGPGDLERKWTKLTKLSGGFRNVKDAVVAFDGTVPHRSHRFGGVRLSLVFFPHGAIKRCSPKQLLKLRELGYPVELH